MRPGVPEVEGPPVGSEEPPEAFARHAGVMSVGTALSRLTGFLRLAAMTYALGVTAGRLSDIYNLANTTPNIVYELLLGGVLSSVFVPVFVGWMRERGREEAWEGARHVLTAALIALTAIAVIGALAAPWIIRLYTLRYPPQDRQVALALGSFFLRWFMPQVVFYGVGTVLIGLLNAHRRFAAPMFAPILNNLVVVATFLAFAAVAGPDRSDPTALSGGERLLLAAGTTLGVAVMTVALWPSLRATGFRFAWRAGLRHPMIRRIAALAGWTLLYVVVNQLGYLSVPILAGERQGRYVAYTSAFILFQLPHAIFAVSVMTALLPAMSSRHADGDREGFRDLLSRGVRATGFVVIPAAFGYLALSRPIVRLLLERGETGPADSALIAGVLSAFALGLFSFSVFQLLLRAYYAMQDTRTPALVNVGAVSLNVAANVVLAVGLGLGARGLALGHATAYTAGALALGLLLRRRLGRIDGRRIAASLAR
ncbi:MAG TPA: murein biosynthesis integral membrane protein MurJ, partial [Actinomycetota bacterium]|nr:murein biosynthesis integral membrane protein MurJ [Actinomycetota bacterium]